MERLLATALDAGLGVAEFWALTPRETLQAVEAAGRRSERRDRERAWLAWHVAALVRTRQMPSLAQMMGDDGEPQALEGEALEARRREFDEMSANFRRATGGDGC